MKKIVLCVLCVLLGLTVGRTAAWLIWYEEPVPPFQYEDYDYLNSAFSLPPLKMPAVGLYDVGEIEGAKDAKEKALFMIEKRYGEKLDAENKNWKKNIRLNARYSEYYDMWYVSSEMEELSALEGEPKVLFRRDGGVVKVWTD